MTKLITIFFSVLFISNLSFAQNRGDRRESFKDYPGATGDYCWDCAFENRNDVPRGRSCKAENRYLVNNTRASINARCRELGWDYGRALEVYSYNEWCKYCNARTRTWDGYDWVFGSCVNGNVKVARCFRR